MLKNNKAGIFRYLALSEVFFPNKGGHIVWFYEVCKYLRDVILLTRCEPQLEKQETMDGIVIKRLSLNRLSVLRPESLPLYLNLFMQGLKMSSRDMKAILSARVLPEGLIGNMVAFFSGMPNIIFAHGEEINRLRWDRPLPHGRKITLAIKRYFLWHAFRRADLVVANSSYTADLLKNGGVNHARISVVNLGADPGRFYPQEKDVSLLRKFNIVDKKVLLTIGRLTPRKGQDMTIRALPAILREIPDAVYLIAGIGEYEAELRDLAKNLGVEDSVRFLGKIDDDILPKLYNLADIFLMPNRCMPSSNDIEGFGIVFLEAGACGKPVIGGLSGGVPDAVVDGETGFLIDANAPEQIISVVLKILQNPELAKTLGQNGRERVCNNLTWKHCSERISSLIASLIK